MASIDVAGLVESFDPTGGLLSGLIGSALETKSVAGLNRTAGRLFRAGAPVIVASAMYRRGGTGDDVYRAAVEVLGVKTAPESGQTKKGYSYDPPVRLRDDKASAAEAAALKRYLADAQAGRDSSAADPTAAIGSTYDWPKLLAAMGVPLASSDAPAWLKLKASPPPSSAAATDAAKPSAPGVEKGSAVGTSLIPFSGAGFLLVLALPLLALGALVVWLVRR